LILPTDSLKVKTPKWTDPELLKYEKEALGLYITSHPLAEHEAKIKAFATTTIENLKSYEDRSTVLLGGLLTSVKMKMTKSDKRMALCELEDMTGTIPLVVWPDTFEKSRDIFVIDNMVFVKGKIDNSRDELQLLVDEVTEFDVAESVLTKSAWLPVASTATEETVKNIHTCCERHRGSVPLFIGVKLDEKHTAWMRTHARYAIQPSKALRTELKNILGDDNVHFSGKETG